MHWSYVSLALIIDISPSSSCLLQASILLTKAGLKIPIQFGIHYYWSAIARYMYIPQGHIEWYGTLIRLLWVNR